ncbi:glycosyltransferase family 4 protein [Facklamia hominis]|uniref:glycosyltransferase family 4 protein n=1 Tax=Facklamia hominis TaxID=178214 RepID=UPI000C7CBBD0|nr:glycosyltransferase family 4 protein [Facklamia hominis]PKY93789.1 glycosyltransferase family 1 protein [Facklamia hominis]
MKRALMYASVASMIDLFNMDNIRILQEMGYQVDVACNFEEGSITSVERVQKFKEELDKLGIRYFQIPIPRSITRISDILKSYKLTKKISKGNYDLVHCHSPIGSVICRQAFKNTQTKIVYTAHGFHFYKGAPLKNWLIFYPIEKYYSRWTDVLITINKEDYDRAKRQKMARVIEYVPGIGIDLSKYNNGSQSKSTLRAELLLPDEALILTSVGELNDNKNHQIVIKALAEINDPRAHYIICGKGDNRDKLLKLAEELNISDKIHLLGFRKDIPEILSQSDIFVFPSLREGLPVSLMEAMASGLPCIVSDIRGNKDLIDNGKGGYLIGPTDYIKYSNTLKNLVMSSNEQNKMRLYNLNKIKMFDKKIIGSRMMKIYDDFKTIQ